MSLKQTALRRDRLVFALLIVTYLWLAGGYALAAPLFEAPDEYYHFAVIEHLVRTGSMPPPEVPPPQTDFQFPSHPWRQMAFHAPLYYRAAAALMSLLHIDTSDFAAYRLNPHARVGIALTRDNANYIAHLGGGMFLGIPLRDPLHDTALAVRAARLLSIALGAVTVISTYALARRIFPTYRRTALLAALAVILIPQFLFITSTVSNDSAVIAFSTLSLALIAHIIRAGDTRFALALALALSMACAAASKASGMGLYPIGITALMYALYKTRAPLRRWIACGAIVAAVWVLAAGGWYARNILVFGEPTAVSLIAASSSPRLNAPVDIIGEGRGMYFSFWGLFGWFNVAPPLWYYTWTIIYCGTAVFGVIMALVRKRPRFSRDDTVLFILLGSACLIIFAGWWSFNQIVFAAQGRLLFPLLGIFCAALAWGFSKMPRLVTLAALCIMGMWTIAMPFLVIAPAYQPPLSLIDSTPADSPAVFSPSGSISAGRPPPNLFFVREPWRSSECLRLYPLRTFWDGESPIVVNLNWAAQCPADGYWSVFAHLVDLELETCIAGDTSHILAQADSMPLGGRLPFPAFDVGTLVRDQLIINPPPDLDHSRQYYLQVGLYDAAGTFMRAFISHPSAVENTTFAPFVGRCAPESVVYPLETMPAGSQ